MDDLGVYTFLKYSKHLMFSNTSITIYVKNIHKSLLILSRGINAHLAETIA
jgi:hypothetical protein